MSGGKFPCDTQMCESWTRWHTTRPDAVVDHFIIVVSRVFHAFCSQILGLLYYGDLISLEITDVVVRNFTFKTIFKEHSLTHYKKIPLKVNTYWINNFI